MIFGRDRTDRRFAHYCRTGDPAALADVFDATAGRLLRVALWLAGNRPDADDLLQRTFLQAIETRAAFRTGERVLPWLMGLLGNQARKQQRERQRAAAAPMRPEPRTSPEVEAAARELTEAVRAVQERLGTPYREVLELHLQRGLDAHEIAAVLHRPAGTVRTQLVRALAQLRRRLPGGFVVGMVVAAALDGKALAAVRANVMRAAGEGAAVVVGTGTGAALAVGGAFVVKKGVLMVCVVVLAVLGAWWVVGPRAGDPGPGAQGAPGGVARAVVVAAERNHGPGAATGETTAPAERRAATPSAAPEARATLRGRCVDEGGRPLAGCVVVFHGWESNEKRMDEWFLDHAQPPEWSDPAAITTGAEGAFEFVFEPPAPFQFALDVRAEGRTSRAGRWSRLAPGSQTDVGAVVLGPGTRVVGRVVDTAGQPQARVWVSLQMQRAEPAGALLPSGAGRAQTGADGSFALRELLAAGHYRLEVSDVGQRAMVSPREIDLDPARAVEELAIVVAPRVDVPTIRGRVVDETGEPVEGVEVGDVAAGGDWSGATRSGEDGAFVLWQAHGGGRDAALGLRTNDHEVDPAPRPCAWGSEGVELRVVRGSRLLLRVTDALGAPVPQYEVRLLPKGRQRQDGRDARARARGEHPDGTVVVPGFTPGDWLLLVAFPRSSGLPDLVQALHQPTNAPQRLDLRALPAAHRWARVLDAEGTPIAGTRVQLCEGFGEPLTDRRPVWGRETWLTNYGNGGALRLAEGETGADGTFELVGPADRAVGLRVLGPGHRPTAVSDVRLDAPGELVVRVARGARLVGRIVPPEAIAELHRLAGLTAGEPFPASQTPRLRLSGEGRRVYPTPADDPRGLAVAADGSFDADGLPPGPWRVQVQAWETMPGGFPRISTTQNLGGTAVVLVDGRTEHHDLDLASILPGTIEGVVLQNGVPLATTTISLQGEDSWTNLVTDAEGRFTATRRPGDYTLLAQRPVADQARPFLRCPAPVRVVRGATARPTFAIATSTLRLQVLDAAGAPVPDLCVVARPGDDGLPPTDAAGRLEVELTSGTITLQVLPQRLRSEAAQQAARLQARANGLSGDPFAADWLTLGTVDLQQGRTHTLELRLPAEPAR